MDPYNSSEGLSEGPHKPSMKPLLTEFHRTFSKCDFVSEEAPIVDGFRLTEGPDENYGYVAEAVHLA